MGRSRKYGPKGAIFYWDSEIGEKPILIADSCEDFVAHLTSDPDSDSSEAKYQEYSRSVDLETQNKIQLGDLSPDLKYVLSRTRIPDAESLIRNGLHHAFEVSDKPRAINALTARELLFLLVYLTSEVRPLRSCEDFLGEAYARVDPEQPTQYPQFHTMMTDSFAPLQAFNPAVKAWWDTAVENWEIFERDGAFFVGQSTIEESINRLRNPELLKRANTQKKSKKQRDLGWKRKRAELEELWYNSPFKR